MWCIFNCYLASPIHFSLTWLFSLSTLTVKLLHVFVRVRPTRNSLSLSAHILVNGIIRMDSLSVVNIRHKQANLQESCIVSHICTSILNIDPIKILDVQLVPT